MDTKKISQAVEALNWLATQIQSMPDRDRTTVEAGIFLALSSVCLGDYLKLVADGTEPYDALRSAADGMTDYRKQLLPKWAPLAEAANVPEVSEIAGD
jgi:hypothetical protein